MWIWNMIGAFKQVFIINENVKPKHVPRRKYGNFKSIGLTYLLTFRSLLECKICKAL